MGWDYTRHDCVLFHFTRKLWNVGGKRPLGGSFIYDTNTVSKGKVISTVALQHKKLTPTFLPMNSWRNTWKRITKHRHSNVSSFLYMGSGKEWPGAWHTSREIGIEWNTLGFKTWSPNDLCLLVESYHWNFLVHGDITHGACKCHLDIN